ncbi:cobalamin (vitamin B12) biosynthesis CbiM protein [Desulfovibrio sp. X2]|uniref:cobalt transporter CbiM n=1 Tax=Desulfovibrio sp. X2 TaxID=941449 RepID=UPI000358ADED|nr:cobalt transporter CbiM [Desulfovibrio sp. X2]EPR37352.1 cobalamin (vitamin B12) biosynthesis CbiM protein [Desulfovibrio sp. X2]
MHISEGVLSAPVLLTGAVLTAAGTAVGLRRMDYDRLMPVAVLSAAFFVASLIHVPVGPTSVHLILNGLIGAILGWAAFPAILVGLALQAVLFLYGGITSLGVNTFNMAMPGVVCFYLFRPLLARQGRAAAVGGFCCGFLGVLLAALLTAASLAFTDEGFLAAAKVLLLAHLPVMCIEGVITALAVSFLARTRPELLAAHQAA